jgi:hypothetical protein
MFFQYLAKAPYLSTIPHLLTEGRAGGFVENPLPFPPTGERRNHAIGK